MKSFTAQQVTLVGKLTAMTVPQLIPLAELAKNAVTGTIQERASKRDLVEIILMRVGDEDEYPTRFAQEHFFKKEERRIALIQALVKAKIVNAHWFPILSENKDTNQSPE